MKLLREALPELQAVADLVDLRVLDRGAADEVLGRGKGAARARIALTSMEHIAWRERPQLRTPTLIAAFTGWNDAGSAASLAVQQMISTWKATNSASPSKTSPTAN